MAREKIAEEWFSDGVDQLKRGELNDAILSFDKAIGLNPEFLEAYGSKGNALFALGRKEEAIECYNRAIELDPYQANAFSGKGNVLCALERYEEAIRCYDRAIELDPDETKFYSNKGNALYALGWKKEAIRCYDIAIKLNPNFANAYSNKGNALSDLGMYDEAIECYDKAIELNPDHALTYSCKASLLFGMGRYQEALKDLNKAESLFESGKITGLSKENISHIKLIMSKKAEFAEKLKEYIHVREKCDEDIRKTGQLISKFESVSGDTGIEEHKHDTEIQTFLRKKSKSFSDLMASTKKVEKEFQKLGDEKITEEILSYGQRIVENETREIEELISQFREFREDVERNSSMQTGEGESKAEETLDLPKHPFYLTPFIERDQLEEFKKLYTENSVTPDSTYRGGTTLLQIAVLHNSNRIIDFLLDHGHNPFKENERKDSAVAYAYRKHQGSIAEDMLKKYFFKSGNDAIRKLFESEADNSSRDQLSFSLLKHICAKNEKDGEIRKILGIDKEGAIYCYESLVDYLHYSRSVSGDLYSYCELSDSE